MNTKDLLANYLGGECFVDGNETVGEELKTIMSELTPLEFREQNEDDDFIEDRKLKVYRGWYYHNKDGLAGISWTLNKGAALFFAIDNDCETGWLATGYINTNRVYAYFVDEEEIIVHHNDVEQLEISQVDEVDMKGEDILYTFEWVELAA